MKVKDLMVPLVALVCMTGIVFGASSMIPSAAAGQAEAKRQQTMALLLPGSSEFAEEAYEGEDTNITGIFKGETGYVIETTVAGYVDDIVLWVGVDNEGLVTGATVRQMSETRGLGSKAMTDISFLTQFLDTNGNAALGENIDGITGATVTSKAVVKAVNSACGFVTGADVTSSATEWGGDW